MTITVLSSESADVPLRAMEVPAPRLGARDVRVEVRAIGVNPVDWKMRSGGPMRLAHRVLGPSGPLVVGVDFSGVVVESGPEADLPVGARVVGATDFSRGQLGSYASQVCVRADQCALLPENVSFEDAAVLPVPGATALRAFEVAGVGAGAKVLVLGASGGVGLVTLQLAKARGMKTVGVCSTRNVALVERMGAIAIDYTKGDPLEAARAHGPFDLVVHAVGTATYPLGKCRSVLAPGGKVALVVVKPADYPCLVFGSVASVLGRPTRARLEVLVRALANGEIEPIVEARIPLGEAEKAHRISRAGKVVGKLLLVP
jgi:NADPH:quinone reductase-like Zn-dependent oxidoreductase